MRFAILLVLMTFSALGNDTLVIEGLKTGKEEVKYLDWQKKYSEFRIQLMVDDHPNYEKKIKYEGVRFYDFLASKGHKITKDDLIIITCTDGYRPLLKGDYFLDKKAVLAYKEVEPKGRVSQDKRWTKVKMEDEYVTPGPYYLIWPSQKGHKHSWPYQIQKIEIKKESEFNELLEITPKDKTTLQGFKVFKSKCLKCHSIKYTGPKGKAPDLAYVTGYRTDHYIRNRIRKGRGKMPPFSKALISDEEIEQVLSYLKEIYSDTK